MPVIADPKGKRMRVISKARLRQLWSAPGNADAKGPLRAWHTHVNSKRVSWQTWGDVKAAFGHASLVGDCVVVNIGGNKYRLIARIRYMNQKVFVLKVMAHREYDEGNWKRECECFEHPPPMRKKKAAQTKRSGRRK
jgi:mRNA interferase HigB